MSYTDWLNLAVAAVVFVVAPIAAVFYVVHTVRHRGWRALGASLWHALGVVLATSWTVLVAAWKTIGWIAHGTDTANDSCSIYETPFDRPEQPLGTYNYRTHKIDDGLDPVGWYYDENVHQNENN